MPASPEPSSIVSIPGAASEWDSACTDLSVPGTDGQVDGDVLSFSIGLADDLFVTREVFAAPILSAGGNESSSESAASTFSQQPADDLGSESSDVLPEPVVGSEVRRGNERPQIGRTLIPSHDALWERSDLGSATVPNPPRGETGTRVSAQNPTLTDAAPPAIAAPSPTVANAPTPQALSTIDEVHDALFSGWKMTQANKQITYTFTELTPNISGDDDDTTNFGLFNDTAQEATRLVLSRISEICALNFVEKSGPADITFRAADISSAAGWAYYPDNNKSDVVADRSYLTAAYLEEGNFGIHLLFHEIGHALGLKHPHEAPTLPYDEDSTNATVMSYSASDASSVGGSAATRSAPTAPRTMMIYDIATLQWLYGARTTTAVSDDLYTLTSRADSAGNYDVRTLWDAGGHDTLQADPNLLSGAVIDLSEGLDHRSYMGRSSWWMAYGANIEDAIGTRFADRLIGNDLNNQLIADAGADSLDGGIGADVMIGGVGNDTYGVDVASDYVVEQNKEGSDLVYSSSTSYVLDENVENLTLINAGLSGTGNGQDNLITGNLEDNTLSGGGGNDTLVGGYGDDLFLIDSNGESIVEYAGGGLDRVQSSVSGYNLGANLEDLTLTSTAEHGAGNGLDNFITGNAENNTLVGDDGNDTLFGGTGIDSLEGGSGDDIYYLDSAADVVTESEDHGTDLVQASVTSYTLAANVEDLILAGSAVRGTGNGLNNAITGNSTANTLDGAAGLDTLAGGAGDDVYGVDNFGDLITENANEGTDEAQSSAPSYTLAANVENLTLVTGGSAGIGNGLDNILAGNSLANTLDGGTGKDTLNGGAGADSLAGGADDDLFVVDSLADVVSEAAGAGTDLVQSTVSGYILGANVENLVLLGTVGTGTGNTMDNLVTGNTSANTLNGGAGNDTLLGSAGKDSMAGGTGNDLYAVDALTDIVTEAAASGTDTVEATVSGYILSANVEYLNLLGSVASGTGNSSNNRITGNAAANTLNGAAGFDTLIGTTGSDTYLIDALTDVVTEVTGEGTDVVQTSVSGYTLGANVENLILAGSVGSGNGNTLYNRLTGNGAANTLNGGIGNDTMTGLTGHDTYVIDTLSDVLVEAANAGTDLVQSSVSGYTLGAYLENLTLLGTVAKGTGNSLNNRLDGNNSSNTLDGGSGSDTLVGLLGSDTYIVDALTDVITEGASAGTDLVQASITGYTLSANVENLLLTGSALSGTGNTLKNRLTGNNSSNTLNGGADADTMVGLTGSDTYIVDALTDVVTETANSGTDTVQASVSGYTLANHIENLVLTGSALSGTGNNLANVLTGNVSANTLSGAVGSDTLIGLTGDDTYVIDALTDVVTEGLSAGTDVVQSSISGYVLANNVENLILTGTAAKGTGNALKNVLTGNASANSLTGGADRDTLLGNGGNDTLTGVDLVSRGVGEKDTLTGGTGSDLFLLGSSAVRFYDDGNAGATGGADYALITDFVPSADRLQLKGTAVQYSLGASPVSGVSGTGLFFDSNGAPGGADELIAIIQSGNTLTTANVVNAALYV